MSIAVRADETGDEEAQPVRLDARFAVDKSREWQTGAAVAWEAAGSYATAHASVPARTIRFIEITRAGEIRNFVEFPHHLSGNQPRRNCASVPS